MTGSPWAVSDIRGYGDSWPQSRWQAPKVRRSSMTSLRQPANYPLGPALKAAFEQITPPIWRGCSLSSSARRRPNPFFAVMRQVIHTNGGALGRAFEHFVISGLLLDGCDGTGLLGT